jgi:ClpP class serine protease
MMMRSSSLAWIWLWTVVVVLTSTTTMTTASTASPSPRRGRFFGRRSSKNATSVDQAEADKKEDNKSSGFFFQFQRNNKQSSDKDEPSEEKVATTSKSKKGKKDDSGGESTTSKEKKKSRADKKVTESNDKVAEESPPSDKKKGRGPFGLFKPVEDVKKSKKEEKEDTEKQEQEVEETSDNHQKDKGNETSVDNEDKKGGETEDTKDETAKNTTQANNHPSSTGRPQIFVYGSVPGAAGHPSQGRTMPTQYGGMGGAPSQAASPFGPASQINHQALLAASMVGIVNVASRLWLIVWLAKRLSAEDELLAPEQHFRWECLNDRYSKDASVLTNVLAKPPLGYSRRRWGGYLKKLRPKTASSLVRKRTGAALPSKSVVVIDITPSGYIEIPYITDVVNFLVASHSKKQFGSDPEIVLLVESPGGGVSLFGLAAAQVGRLKQMGLNVTICVDSVAASGGYMIASQATHLIGAPFAQLGSIGVMSEGLNFNNLLNNYGVKPMILKAGKEKNRLSAFGPVTENDLKEQTKQLEKIHEAFIDLCLTERPSLDPDICDGTVLVAAQGLNHGLVDRVLTSEEYIWECIQDGAHVLKLHKASAKVHPNYFLFRAMDILPHLKQKLKQFDTAKLLSAAIQGSALVGVILRAIR